MSANLSEKLNHRHQRMSNGSFERGEMQQMNDGSQGHTSPEVSYLAGEGKQNQEQIEKTTQRKLVIQDSQSFSQ